MLDPVSIDAIGEICVIIKSTYNVSAQEGALICVVVESLGRVPMVKSHPRSNAGSNKFIDDIVIESNTKTVYAFISSSIREDPRPRKRHSEILNAHSLHHCDVLLVLVVKVVSNVTILIVMNGAWDLTELIPDAWGSAIFSSCSLNLIGSCGNSPGKG
jgi:hypothetical protein